MKLWTEIGFVIAPFFKHLFETWRKCFPMLPLGPLLLSIRWNCNYWRFRRQDSLLLLRCRTGFQHYETSWCSLQYPNFCPNWKMSVDLIKVSIIACSKFFMFNPNFKYRLLWWIRTITASLYHTLYVRPCVCVFIICIAFISTSRFWVPGLKIHTECWCQ